MMFSSGWKKNVLSFLVCLFLHSSQISPHPLFQTSGTIFLLDKYFLSTHFPTVGWRKSETTFSCIVIMFFPPFPLFTFQNKATPAHFGLNQKDKPQPTLTSAGLVFKSAVRTLCHVTNLLKTFLEYLENYLDKSMLFLIKIIIW